jgi:mono/diheme cytochrome c family protein
MKRVFTLGLLAMIVVAALTACGGGAPAAPKGNVDKGKTVFASTCSACHGANAKGVPSLGKDLTTSTFIKGMSDDQVLDFLKKGRPASDPANTTKVDMPAKGGNPALTDSDLYDVIAYIRTLNK